MPDSRSPNILLITTDQQRVDTLGCYGAEWMRTPNLDRVAAEGILFERAYTTSPLCTPARVSLFTGRYPSRHGAWNVGCNAEDDGAFISHAFAAAGYRTHHIGKAHWQANLASADVSVEALHGNRRFPGWSGPYYGFESVELSIGHNGYGQLAGHYAEWVKGKRTGDTGFRWSSRSKRSFGAEAIDWGLPWELHAGVWTANRALAFLEEHDRDRPFFLHLGFADPHHPHALPEDFPGRVDPMSVPLPKYRDGELSVQPPHYLAAREGALGRQSPRGRFPMAGQGEGFDYRDLPERDVREARAYYYSLCQLVDHEIGRVLDALDRLGIAENTLIVFTSDHGELLGDHGLWLKGCFPYNEVLQVPLLFRWPRRLSPGRRVSAPVSLVDIGSMVLSAAGVEPGPRDGVDWMPYLLGESRTPPRSHVFVEHMDDPSGIAFEAVVTEENKLVRWQDGRMDFSSWDDQEPEATDLSELRAVLDAETSSQARRLPRYAYS